MLRSKRPGTLIHTRRERLTRALSIPPRSTDDISRDCTIHRRHLQSKRYSTTHLASHTIHTGTRFGSMNAKIPRCICSISKQALKSPRFRIPRPTYTSMSSFHPTSFASSSTIRPFSSSSRQNQSPPSNTDSAVPIKSASHSMHGRADEVDN